MNSLTIFKVCNFNVLHFRLHEKDIVDFEERNRVKKQREKERQRTRRMDPEFRAKERARNCILKRIARKKNYYNQEVQYFVF